MGSVVSTDESADGQAYRQGASLGVIPPDFPQVGAYGEVPITRGLFRD